MWDFIIFIVDQHSQSYSRGENDEIKYHIEELIFFAMLKIYSGREFESARFHASFVKVSFSCT